MKIMAWQPTVKQGKFVDALLAGKNITQSAEYAGCTKQAWYGRWRHDNSFLGYLERRRSEQAAVRLPAVDKALFDKAVSGDIQATRLIYEIFGHLRTNAPRVVQVHNEYYDGLSEKELDQHLIDLVQQAEREVGGHIGELEPVVPLRRP